MFCHKCGNQLPEGAIFCQKCGEKVILEDSVQNSLDTSTGNKSTLGDNNSDKYSGTINNQPTQNADSKKSGKRLYDDNIKPYYRKQFERISSGQKPNFNWAAFFLNGWMQLYNGCTAIFCKTFLPLLISIFLVSLLGIIGTLSFNFTLMAITPVLGIVIALGSVVLSVINGFKFNKWYYQDIVSNPGKVRNRKGFWILIIAETVAIAVLFLFPKVYQPSYDDLLGDWSDEELFDMQDNDDIVNLPEANINEEGAESFGNYEESGFASINEDFYTEYEEAARPIIIDWFKRHPLMEPIRVQFANELTHAGESGDKYVVYEMYQVSGEKYGIFFVSPDNGDMVMDSVMDSNGKWTSIQASMDQWYLEYYWGWTDNSGYYAKNYSEDIVIIYDEMDSEILEYSPSYDSYAICNYDGQFFLEYDDGSEASEISIADFAGAYGYDASFEEGGFFYNFYYYLEVGEWDGYSFSVFEEWRGNSIFGDEYARPKSLIVDTLTFDTFATDGSGYETHTLTYIPANDSPFGQDVIYIDGDQDMPFVRE